MAEKETATRFDDEQIIEIEIERLRSFKNHPFKVEDDKDMHLLKDSMEKALHREALSQTAGCRIIPAGLGEKIGDLASLGIALDAAANGGKA